MVYQRLHNQRWILRSFCGEWLTPIINQNRQRECWQSRKGEKMHKFLASAGLIGIGLMSANVASAQTQTGAELIGHTVDVAYADGTRNSVYFGPNGQARINGTNGATAAASWFTEGSNLCLQTAAAKECWGYGSRFAAGRTMAMTSSCDGISQWTARTVNAPPPPPRPVARPVAPPPPPPPPPPAVMAGERG